MSSFSCHIAWLGSHHLFSLTGLSAFRIGPSNLPPTLQSELSFYSAGLIVSYPVLKPLNIPSDCLLGQVQIP